MWKRLWRMRLLRIAAACAMAIGVSLLEPVDRGAENLLRRILERNYRTPPGSRWWRFRAADRTDRAPGWTCGEDPDSFYLAAGAGIRSSARSSLPELADPCDPGEDPDTLVPDDALVRGRVDSTSNSTDSADGSARR